MRREETPQEAPVLPPVEGALAEAVSRLESGESLSDEDRALVLKDMRDSREAAEEMGESLRAVERTTKSLLRFESTERSMIANIYGVASRGLRLCRKASEDASAGDASDPLGRT